MSPWPFDLRSRETTPTPPTPAEPATLDQLLLAQQDTNQLLRALLVGLVAHGVKIVMPGARVVPITPPRRPSRVYTDQDVTQVTRAEIFTQQQVDLHRANSPHLDPRSDMILSENLNLNNPDANAADPSAVSTSKPVD